LKEFCNKNLYFWGSSGNIMLQMIKTLKRLISVKSTLEVGELAVAQVVAEVASQRGLECHVDSWVGNRANILCKLRSSGEQPGILFLAHLDVVDADEKAWQTPPFEGIEKAGRIYGRGAVDMKGGLTAIIEAMGRISASGVRLKGDVYLAGVGGEETDSAGIERFVAHVGDLGKLAGVIICEPTGLGIVTAHRGMLWVKITTFGKSAHGSMPHLGINAIESMLIAIEKVHQMDAGPVKHPRCGSGTMSINRIHAGTATNIIPDSCSAEIDVRVVPGQSTTTALERFTQLVSRLQGKDPKFKAKLDILKRCEALETDDNCQFVRSLCKATGIPGTMAVGFTTDGPWLTPLGVPIVIFGPGDPELCHKPDECIEIDLMEKAASYYQAAIMHFLT
jgi:succinyl-diaminopimelate desuccinylase